MGGGVGEEVILLSSLASATCTCLRLLCAMLAEGKGVDLASMARPVLVEKVDQEEDHIGGMYQWVVVQLFHSLILMV